MGKPSACMCPTCPWVEYMNNVCSHPEVRDRPLDWPAPPSSHFPSRAPEWCPLASASRLAMLEAELLKVQDERNAQYWAFTRQARGKPVTREVFQRIDDLEREIREMRKRIPATHDDE